MKFYSIILLLLFISFSQMKDNKGYIKYQTFDEYKLIGVGTFNIKEPYVLVKKELDTIFVIKSNDRNNILTYVNKGKFWYYQPKEQQKIHNDSIIGVITTISEKFIINDTIFVFSYFPTLTYSKITIHTKKGKTVIEGCKIIFDNEENVYEKIRDIASNYKDSISYREGDLRPDNGWYETFNKVFKSNLLYLYDSRDKRKPAYIYKLNSLGEFDIKNAVQITP